MQQFDTVSIEGEALEHSDRMMAHLGDIISREGPMPFADYMQQVLYAPGLGYYAAGKTKFGSAGDFVTAPEISPLFSHCLANQCQQVLQQQGGDILEFGAGSGIMAAAILEHLQRLDCLPRKYFILDLSAQLRQRQQQTLQARVPELLERVEWLERLPDAFIGVILANEVLDAMPVSIFRSHAGDIEEQYVELENGQMQPCWRKPSAQLAEAVDTLQTLYGRFEEGYLSEVNLYLPAWLKAVSESLQQGAILLIDYGYSGAEYYHPERRTGTLICHYRHRAHDDPLKLPGLQDITANVDFSAVWRAGEAAGLQLAGYTPQANFLIATGIEALLARHDPEDEKRFMQLAQAVKVLMLPSEMGERFKVLGLVKDFDADLQGFGMRNLRERL